MEREYKSEYSSSVTDFCISWFMIYWRMFGDARVQLDISWKRCV